jgi:hypothetical protein
VRVQFTTEMGMQASALANWLWISTAALSVGALVQWLRSAQHDADEDGTHRGRTLAKYLTFAAVGSLFAVLLCLVVKRQSQIDCCY